MTDPAEAWRTRYRHPTEWDRTFDPMTLPELFEVSAAAHAKSPLIDFMGRKFDYAETLDGARRVAAGLKALGIKKGDRVGLFLPNVPHYIAAYYGALRMGAIVVNFSPLYSAEELIHQVNDSGARLLFTLSAKALLPTALDVLDRSSLEQLVVGSIAGALPATKSLFYRWFKGAEIAERPHDPRVTAFSALIANDGDEGPPVPVPDDIALIQYTGGTTGTPKGAMLTHANMTANARQADGMDPWNDGNDRILAALPLFHIFANTCVLNRTVFKGGELVMVPRFDAGQVLASIERVKVTSLPGVPTMYQALLDHPRIERTDLSTLRVCISGGAPLPAELKAKFEARTGARVVEGYGLTESSGVVSANPYAAEGKAGTVGQPIPGTRIVLVSKEDPHILAPDGEPGEITIAGPQVMKGYWQRPDADAEVFVDGRLRTGDVGVIDEDGFLKIVDRLKDMINVSGFKVFPSQVEAVLYSHEAVKEALVIGIPDAHSGERPKAFVTLNVEPGNEEAVPVTPEALMAFTNAHVGKHERLVALEIRLTLPKTLVGKLSRKELEAEERAKAAAA